MICVANAPVSYGVFGLARPDRTRIPTGSELLDLVRQAGYDGIDSGARGLFGSGQKLVDNLAAADLRLAGGWIDLPFATGTDEEFETALKAAQPLLDDFALVSRQQETLPPLPTLADSGDAIRKQHPGGGENLELDPESWERLTRRVERVVTYIRDLGLEPTFHHHVSTYIETPREIERLLADTSVDLTLDTGHLIAAGGDPLDALSRWGKRINHIHLKDVDRSVLDRGLGGKDPVREIWEKRGFVALGEGDLDVPAVLRAIGRSGYSGFVVVEQDVVLLNDGDLERAAREQVANRAVVKRWLA